ncbi:hypothetical protein [Hymenobacter sp. DG25A]|uniref:hypothetical protein n=1 Tax=Hymenobacter sp. DG25A TaxID=1385663 RepID=UPI0012FC1451|nr:hypothetical protein [Hymenobacter sp. DG25A]
MIKEITFSLSEFLVPILGAIVAALGYLVKQQKDEIKGIQSQLSDKKYNVYNEVISVIFDIVKSTKGLKKQKENDLISKLIDIRKDLYIYAPDNIIRKFNEWQQYNELQPGNSKHILIYMDLIVLIRKDMGHRKTVIHSREILRSIMLNSSEFELFMESLDK